MFYRDGEPEYKKDIRCRIYGGKSIYDQKMETAKKECTFKTLKVHDDILKTLKKEQPTYIEAYTAIFLADVTLEYESEFVNHH